MIFSMCRFVFSFQHESIFYCAFKGKFLIRSYGEIADFLIWQIVGDIMQETTVSFCWRILVNKCRAETDWMFIGCSLYHRFVFIYCRWHESLLSYRFYPCLNITIVCTTESLSVIYLLLCVQCHNWSGYSLQMFDALNKLSKRLVAISNAVTCLDKQNRDRLQGTTTLHEKLGRGLLFDRKNVFFIFFINFILVAFIFS